MDKATSGVEPTEPRPRDKPIGRRVVLGMLGLGAVGIVAGARIQDALTSALEPILSHDPTGLSTLLPIAGNWRIYTVTGDLPQESDQQWRLQVDGLAPRPPPLTYDQLRAMPAPRLVKDFQCVTGWRVGGVPWLG